MSVLTVESRVRRLLTPDPEALLADIVSEMSDPVLRSEWEARLRKRLDAKEEYAEQDQQVFNAAYGKALELGFDDPGEFARRAVKQAVHERIHAKKVSAIRKAPLKLAVNEANRDAVADEVASRTASSRRRRNPQQDREYLEIMGSAERAGRLSASSLVGAEIKKRLGNYRLPHWEKTTLPLKVMALSLETSLRGGRTINLRIGHEVSKKALASSCGPVSFVQNQVRETFKRRFADDSPEFWFVRERDNDDLFHLHGAYVDQAHIPHAGVDAALRDAAGWSAAQGVGLAQKSAELKDPIFWAHYTVKQMKLTAGITERKILASTAELRDASRGAWDRWRSKLPNSFS